nr:MAG TPA: hypothetical protein [Caudoviricetes sp.]
MRGLLTLISYTLSLYDCIKKSIKFYYFSTYL